MEDVRVALLGCGTVGTQVARLLQEQAADLTARAGAWLNLVGIAVRDASAPRDPSIDRALLTEDASGLIAQADIVIELIGGIEPARTLILEAFEQGASVVTGNKALLAAHGPELYEAAARADVDLYYEAAVAGAVPIVYGLREALAGDRITAVLGIVNGTTNYILDEMTTKGLGFDEVLAEAQRTHADVQVVFANQGESASEVNAYLESRAQPVEAMFDYVYAELPPDLVEQRAEALAIEQRGKH